MRGRGAAILPGPVTGLALTTPSLPVERRYRPTPRGRYYARSLPVALVAGLGAGILVVAAPLDPLLTVGGIWAAVIWRLVRTRRRAHAIAKKNDEAQAMLAAGDVVEASQMFDELCRTGSGMPAFHSLLVYNRAVAFLRAGELQRAEGLLRGVLEAGWFSQRRSLFSTHLPLLYSALAASTVLQGRLDEAVRWQAQAHEVVSNAKRGQLLTVDTLVDGRRGSLDDLVRRVDETLPRAENLLTASQIRLVHLLKAFALERTQASGYRDNSRAGDLQSALAAGRPTRAEELDHVVRHWPEFREFLELHGVWHDRS